MACRSPGRGGYLDLRSAATDRGDRSGADAEHWAGRLAHDVIGMRQRGATVQRAMVVQSQHNQIFSILSCEIENCTRRFSGNQVVVDRRTPFRLCDVFYCAAKLLHQAPAIGVP